jgi:feruloyl esterase
MRAFAASVAVLAWLLSMPRAGPVPRLAAAGQTTPAAGCAALAALALPQGAIRVAAVHKTGEAVPPGTSGSLTAPRPFCRVAATLRPSSDSAINIEVWLPVSGWNGKLLGVGNGGFSGAISYGALRDGLTRGYAAASTDTGHEGRSAEFALGHPEKVIDFGWRSIHEMTVAARRIIAAYYGRGPRLSYWNGCSAGGRQGLKVAQRLPEDYDGIVAGAPGLDWSGRAARAVQVAKMLEGDPAARLTDAARDRLARAALAACDAADGLADRLISRPDRCRFDPAVLQCRTPGARDCLTPAQVAAARLIYASPANPRSGRPIPGLLPGSEPGWTDLGWTASARATGLDHFRYLVFGDPAWTIDRFDFDRDIVRAEEADAGTVNALDANIAPFFARGGKLLQYHGWSDPQITPAISTQYYERVAQALGGADRLQGSYRLFMAPGMGHCSGGTGPSSFDMLAALEAWVEEERPPNRVVASQSVKGAVTRTRPLCPYPQIAMYTGTGSVDEAVNFVCRAP